MDASIPIIRVRNGEAVGYVEHGEKEPCLNTLDVLAKSFGMSIAELTDGL
jgi:hypothetical protein